MSVNEWFYIRSTNSGHVISAIPNEETYLRSQVIVTAPTLNDHELWCWKGQCLTNKATDLVLDIREGIDAHKKNYIKYTHTVVIQLA